MSPGGTLAPHYNTVGQNLTIVWCQPQLVPETAHLSIRLCCFQVARVPIRQSTHGILARGNPCPGFCALKGIPEAWATH